MATHSGPNSPHAPPSAWAIPVTASGGDSATARRRNSEARTAPASALTRIQSRATEPFRDRQQIPRPTALTFLAS